MSDDFVKMEDLASESLITELKNRGYHVYNEPAEALEDIHDDDIRETFYNRKLTFEFVQPDPEAKYKNFLWDLYYDIIYKTPEQFFRGMNEIFLREINRRV